MVVTMQINPDMKAGLWMIVQAFKERNYLYAYDIYMRLAVGKTCTVVVCSMHP